MSTTVKSALSSSRVVTETLSIDEVPDGDTERIVLECDCRDKLVLGSFVVAWLLWHDKFECGACGKGFIITGMVSERDSWMANCLERIEGKEARQEYYARLERLA